MEYPAFNSWATTIYHEPENIKYKFGKFEEYSVKNVGLNWSMKCAAIKASPFVVSLISYMGINRLYICSGVIVNSNGTDEEFCSTILTSASLLKCPTSEYAIADNIKVDVYHADGNLYEGKIEGYDFHYNVAEISIKSKSFLKTAIVGNIDSSTKPALIALGRYYDHPYQIMAAPGVLRLIDSGLDCEELLVADCKIPKNGIGGPIITCNGRVMGISFYEESQTDEEPQTPFLPINIALECLKHLQKYRKVPRPWLGARLSDLITVGVGELETLTRTFPNLVEGVVVRQMESESVASHAGLCTGDVIVELDGQPVRRTLEFRSILFDKADKPVDVIVKRAGSTASLTFSLDPRRPRKVNRWP